MTSTSSLSRRTMKAGGWVFAARIFSKSFDFITLLVLARILTPQDFGLIAIAMVVVQILEAILEFPVAQALVGARRVTRAHLDTGFTLSVARSIIVAGLALAAAFPLAQFYSDPRLVSLTAVIALGPAFRSLISIRMATYQRALDTRPLFVSQLLGKVVSLIAAVTAAIVTKSYWALAIGTVSAPLITAMVSYFYAPYSPRFSLAERRYFAGILSWTTLSQVFRSLLWNFDKLFLGRVVPDLTLGRFYLADTLSQAPIQMLVMPVVGPFTAAFANNRVRGKLGDAYLTAVRSLVFLVAPILVTIGLMAEQLIALLFGPEWAEAAPILQAFAFIGIFQIASAPLTAICMATQRTAALAIRAAVAFAIQVPAVFYLFGEYGLAGVIGARAIVAIVVFLHTMVLIKSIIGASLRDQTASLISALPPLIAAGGALIGVTAVVPLTGGFVEKALILGATIALAAAVYVSTAYVIWRVRKRPPGAEALMVSMLTELARHLKKSPAASTS